LHFGRASEACHISISALSRNIRSLEQELGVELFNRDNRSVELTSEGETFRQYARNSLSQWNAIRTELAGNSGVLHGEISLYCSVTAAYTILFDLLNKCRQYYPDIELNLHTGNADHAIARITNGEEEITIAAHPNTLPRGVVFKPITDSPLVFITSINADKVLDWSEVPMILSEGGLSRVRVNRWFKDKNISPNIYSQVVGFEAIVSMVSLGLGVGVVPKIVLDNSPMANRVRIINVDSELEPYDIGLFTLKKSLKNPLVNAFWSLVE